MMAQAGSESVKEGRPSFLFGDVIQASLVISFLESIHVNRISIIDNLPVDALLSLGYIRN